MILGLGFPITTDQVPGKRSPGSPSWDASTTPIFVEPRHCGRDLGMQYLPVADAKALAVYDALSVSHCASRSLLREFGLPRRDCTSKTRK
jgi:hypothetical protein